MKAMQKKHPLPEDTGSEFGKGFIYCLTLWSMHFHNSMGETCRKIKFLSDKSDEELEKIINKSDPKHDYGKDMDTAIFYMTTMRNDVYKGDKLKTLASHIQLWANGASDHLYEITVPEQFKGTEIEKKVLELQDKGLDVGHGTGLMSRDVTWEEFTYLQTLTGEIIKLVDKALGVEQVDARFGEL